MAHLGDPEKRSSADSLAPVAKRLHQYLPDYKVVLVDDFQNDDSQLKDQKENEIVLLENIRFYPGEKGNDPEFLQQLASYGDAYVNDGFGVSHRKSVSVVGLPTVLPAYGGLLLKKEVSILDKVMKHPQKPFVAIIGGKKISSKIKVIKKLTSVADYVILGGGLANTFLAADGLKTGKSLVSSEDVALAKELLDYAKKEHTQLLIPQDVVVGDDLDSEESEVKKVENLSAKDLALDIGPETQADFGAVINEAKTIIWNGPVGYIENQEFKRGTDFLYYAITQNENAVSVVGGGDTLAALAKKEYLEKITHISTGGGAMLEFIENGTLPGIEALKK